MKLLSYLSHATLVTSAAFTLGLAFDVQALPLFGAAVTASLLLIASGDYAASGARLARWQSQSVRVAGPARRRKYSLPFAA
jgi:hypothetical protein